MTEIGEMLADRKKLTLRRRETEHLYRVTDRQGQDNPENITDHPVIHADSSHYFAACADIAASLLKGRKTASGIAFTGARDYRRAARVLQLTIFSSIFFPAFFYALFTGHKQTLTRGSHCAFENKISCFPHTN